MPLEPGTATAAQHMLPPGPRPGRHTALGDIAARLLNTPHLSSGRIADMQL